MLDATRLAEKLLGDAIYANVLMLGAAWQAGLVPLSEAALLRAIEINGADVEGNVQAFAIGRWAVRPSAARRPRGSRRRRAAGRGSRHRRRRGAPSIWRSTRTPRLARALPRAHRRGRARVDPDFAMAMAKGYHKLLAYKDEYEVARLHAETLRGGGRRAVHRRPRDALPSRAADPRRQDAAAAEEARVRPLDAARRSGCSRRFKGLRGTVARSLRLQRRAAHGARADRRVRARHGPGAGGLSPGDPRDRDRAGRAAAGDPRLRPRQGGRGRGSGGAGAELLAALRRRRRPAVRAAE